MKDKVVVITGASKGIGAELARRLAAKGSKLVLAARSEKELEEVAAACKKLGASVVTVKADVTTERDCQAIVAGAMVAYGRLDALVNNASSFHPTPIGSITLRDWDDLIGTNLRAPLFLAQAAAPALRRARGAIVNIVDIHAERPLADFVVYSVAKAGLAGLTRSLALELAPEVRVNGVAPGSILWPDSGAHFPPAEQQRIVAQTPLARVGGPEDIAGAVKYFLFDAPFVTGQVLAVDGGRDIHL